MKLAENTAGFQRLHADLHDLCQPLTALQCRLELGKMLGKDVALRDAVDGALEETQRMFVAVSQMRESLQRVEQSIR